MIGRDEAGRGQNERDRCGGVGHQIGQREVARRQQKSVVALLLDSPETEGVCLRGHLSLPASAVENDPSAKGMKRGASCGVRMSGVDQTGTGMSACLIQGKLQGARAGVNEHRATKRFRDPWPVRMLQRHASPCVTVTAEAMPGGVGCRSGAVARCGDGLVFMSRARSLSG